MADKASGDGLMGWLIGGLLVGVVVLGLVVAGVLRGLRPGEGRGALGRGADTSSGYDDCHDGADDHGRGDLKAQGKEVFASAGCGGCHTLADAGATGTVGPNLDDAKPNLQLVIDRVTNGKGAMPSFKGQLDAAQIQAVATYVSQAAAGG